VEEILDLSLKGRSVKVWVSLVEVFVAAGPRVNFVLPYSLDYLGVEYSSIYVSLAGGIEVVGP